MIYRSASTVIIGVNSLHHPNRRRFTIAHELGHYFLHKGIEVHIDHEYPIYVNARSSSSQSKDPEEVEANIFAAEILMPKIMLQDEIKDRVVDIDDDQFLRDLAKKYGVSTVAMTYRLSNIQEEK